MKVDIKDKIVSLSDEDASMIVKGQRDPVVGYKPQIGRSENGFITAIIVPEGNASDSGHSAYRRRIYAENWGHAFNFKF